MSYIETHALQHNGIQRICAEWDSIVSNPPYQRNGDIWPLEKKQLLIDSLINGYDIPKIYFHKYDREQARKIGKTHAIIDGRQRLETIVSFVSNQFSLSDDFIYLDDDKIKANNMNYDELGKKYPRIKSKFDSFNLPIIEVVTDDLELIEDMFSRLNEAVPLNAPEKRRAIGGDMVAAVDEVAAHPFFEKKVKFSNKRYQHKEAAIRLLFVNQCLKNDRLVDTKKPYLDQFVIDYKKGKKKVVDEIKGEVISMLDSLAKVFNDKDVLLFAQTNVVVFSFVFLNLKNTGLEDNFSRQKLDLFFKKKATNRTMAEKDIATANFELLEYDRLSQQGTNDASSIKERWRILSEWLKSN